MGYVPSPPLSKEHLRWCSTEEEAHKDLWVQFLWPHEIGGGGGVGHVQMWWVPWLLVVRTRRQMPLRH